MNIPNRVARGAVYLDLERPGWWRKIDTSSLNMRSGVSCVLGQAIRPFYDALKELGLTSGEAEKLGFTFDGYHHDTATNWSALTEEWLPVINARQDADAQLEREISARLKTQARVVFTP